MRRSAQIPVPFRPQFELNELRWPNIGGIPQAVHVLATVPTAPVLLFLHGGPGVPHIPFAYVNAELAESFTVVHWDQRGAGKTFALAPGAVPESFAQLVNDGIELVEWLCAEFAQERIVVVGHSCGSALATVITARCPERILTFIGVGQVSDLQAAEVIRHMAAVRIALSRGDGASVRRLRELGPPPYRSPEESDVLERLAATLTANYVHPFLDPELSSVASASGLYSESELVLVDEGIRRSQEALWPELFEELDLNRQAPSLEVPVGFIVGGHDLFAPPVLAWDYFGNLRVPKGKQFCRLDGVGHWMHLEATNLYRTVLRSVVRRCIQDRRD